MRNVTLKQLRAFAAVARTGSVTLAAQTVGVTPPAVTLQMRHLQQEVGVPLIERTTRGTVPTEAGRELLWCIERIESILAESAATLAGMAGSEHGTVAVGVISTAKYFAPHALAAFTRQRPGVELRLTVGNRAEIIDGLGSHDIDIAIMGRPPHELDVVATEIGAHPHVIVAPPDHRLAAARGLAPADLLEERFLVREPGSGTRSLMERFFTGADVAPHVGMQIGSNETIKQAVMAGLGIAFLSAHTIEAEVTSGRLAVLDVQGLPIVRQWHVVHLKERRLIPAAGLLRHFLAEEGYRFLPTLNPRRE